VVDDPDPVAEDVRLLQVLRRQEDGDPRLAAKEGDLLPQRGATLRIEPGRGLVEKEDLRRVDEREREIKSPFHPAGVARDLAIGGIRKPDPVQELLRARGALPLRDVLQRRLQS
jgi:hypothetical protein